MRLTTAVIWIPLILAFAATYLAQYFRHTHCNCSTCRPTYKTPSFLRIILIRIFNLDRED